MATFRPLARRGWSRSMPRGLGRASAGRFAGIFGFMINLGRFGITKLGPALLAGFVFLGLWRIPPLHWRWLFWVPAGVATLVAIWRGDFRQGHAGGSGFSAVQSRGRNGEGKSARQISVVFYTIVSNPVDLDRRRRLCLHRRGAAEHRPMVSALHAGGRIISISTPRSFSGSAFLFRWSRPLGR